MTTLFVCIIQTDKMIKFSLYGQKVRSLSSREFESVLDDHGFYRSNYVIRNENQKIVGKILEIDGKKVR